MKNSLIIFMHMLRRDFLAHRAQLPNYFINHGLLYTAMYAFSFGFIQPAILLPQHAEKLGATLYVGSLLLILMIITLKLMLNLLFEFEGDRFYSYQITFLNPRLVILERIIFSTLFTFILVCPFVPVGKLILGARFDLSHISWPLVTLVLLVSSLLCSSFHMLTTCLISNSNKISSMWARFSDPLFMLGGFRVPWHVYNAFSPTFGLVLLANPFLYVTEGLRAACLGQQDYIPLWTCVGAMLGFSIIFIVLSWIVFKRRVDHI